MKQYYLSVDAGGSKVHLLLFDSEFHRIDFEVASSANPTLVSKEQIRANMTEAFSKLFTRQPQVKRLSSVYICSVCPPEILLGTLYEFVAVEHIQPIDEGRMGMYAGCVSGSAVMTLSGTGSDIYYVKDNRTLGAIGGWGQMIADEGSGFWIGKQGLLAAIYFFEGRGKPTMLNQLIANQFIPYDFRGSVFQLYTLDSPSRGIAALSRVVDQAARQGDAVAIDIFHRAAALLRDQVVALHRFYPDAANLPIMVMGGSFKNYLLLDLFSKAIAETYPGRTVQKPIFEPVAGGVFCYLKELGLSDENAKEIMLQNFSTELYPLPQK